MINKPVTIILSAVYGEVAWLVDRLKKKSIIKTGRRKVIFGSIAGKYVMILATGPGMLNTAQALTSVIEYAASKLLTVRLIIQTGCAGAFKESGMQTGDIGIAVKEIDAHLGLEPEQGGFPLTELPFSLMGKEKNIKNIYPTDQKAANLAHDALNNYFSEKNIIVKKGPFVTVSTITATEKRANDLYSHFKPCMENMEGAASAYLGIFYDIPFLEIRCASNIVGRRDKKSWDLSLSFERSSMAVFRFLDMLDNNKF